MVAATPAGAEYPAAEYPAGADEAATGAAGEDGAPHPALEAEPLEATTGVLVSVQGC